MKRRMRGRAKGRATGGMAWWLPVLTGACLMAAGCDGRRAEGNRAADNAAAVNETAMAGNAAEEMPQRSIIRPDVAPSPTPPPAPEPIEAVIAFGASGLKLDDAGRQAIDALLAAETTATGGPIILRGNTDSRGADGDNLVASRKRAEAVRDYMVAKGVAADRIRIIALGETRPIAPNARPDGSDDPEGRAKNRRVDVEIRPRITVPLPDIPAPDNAANGAADGG